MKLSNTGRKHEVTPAAVIKRPPFQLGYFEAKAGVPFNPDKSFLGLEGASLANAQYTYERGRAFAQIYTGRLMRGRGVCKKAAAALTRAAVSKAII